MADTASDTQEKKRNKPTDKMVAAARAAATRQGIELPPAVESDFEACKVFLDEHLSKPSPKALAFAERIAKAKGLELPAAARTNSRDLSAWIDEHNDR